MNQSAQYEQLAAAIKAQGITLEQLPAALADLQKKCFKAAEDYNKRVQQKTRTA